MTGFRNNSWGRTRGPKSLASPGDHINVQNNGAVDVVLVATLDAITDGYSTENQRYLHTLVIDQNAGTSLTVTLYGYCHAFGAWFPINALNGSTAATITVADSGEAPASQTAAHREMVTYEIAGIDRVAFVGTTADVSVFAACSTF